jgi:hypothetical protein
MERRASKRIPINVALTFFYENDLYSGIAQNVSEKGMYFSTPDVFLPHDSLIELIVPLKEKLMNVQIRVNRLKLKSADTVHFSMGADVLNPSKEYLDFVNSFNPAA